jgi:pimeloyl-ACP methyl ester carboxylesterase
MTRAFFSSILVLVLVACTSTAPTTTTSTSSSPAAVPTLWAGLTPGQYRVGLVSSTLPTDPHPLQVTVWYPAYDDGKQLHYRDYLLLNLTELPQTPTAEARAKSLSDAKAFLTTNGVSAASADSLINAPMYAHASARIVPGQFPLVMIVQGNGQSASAQAVLAEFLASHGYVVATIPSITRTTGPMQSETEIAPKAELEVADIDRAVNSLAQWQNINRSIPPAIVAHSFGSRSALMYALHHPVSAIVSLEGGIGLATGQESMVKSPVMDLKLPAPPILHFYEMNDDRAVPDFRLLRSLHTPDLQLVRLDSPRHVHFSSDGFAAVMLPDMAKVTHAGPALKQDVMAYAQQTLAYLDKWTAVKPAS